MPNDPKLDVTVRLKDRYSKQFNKMQKDTTKNATKMKRSIGGMGAAFGKMKGAIVGAIGAYAGFVAIQKTWNAVKTYANLEAHQDVFKRLGKQINASDNALEKWGKTVKYTVSEADLLEQVNKGISTGFIKTEEQFNQLAHASVVLSRAWGKEVLPTLVKINEAMIGGRRRMFREYGIDVQKIFDLEKKRTEAGGVLDLETKRRMLIEQVMKRVNELEGAMSEKERERLTLLQRIEASQVNAGDAVENIGKAAKDMIPVMQEWRQMQEDIAYRIAKTAVSYKGLFEDLKGYLKSVERVTKAEKTRQEAKTKQQEEDKKRRTQGDIQGLYGIGGTSREDLNSEAAREWFRKWLGKNKKPPEKVNKMTLDLWDKNLPGPAVPPGLGMQGRGSGATDLGSYTKTHTYKFNQSDFAREQALFSAGAPTPRPPSGIERTFQAAKTGLDNYMSFANDSMSRFADTTENTFRALEYTVSNVFFDAMMNDMRSFKEYVSDFARDIASILSNMMAKKLVTSAISGIGTLIGGGGSAAAGGVTWQQDQGVWADGMAEGGVVSKPSFITAGEAGPEAVIPLSKGRSVPVEMKGGGGKAVDVNFHIRTNDANSFRSSLVQNKDAISGIIKQALGNDTQLRSTVRAV